MRLSALLVSLGLFSSAPGTAKGSSIDASDMKGVQWTSCALEGSDSGVVRYAECATLTRPLDPTGTVTGEITLHMARLHSAAPKPASDAVLAINGGPGGSSRDMLVDLWPAFQALARDRDVIVIDQRGTGQSSPLRCPAPADEVELMATPTADSVKACLDGLAYDPRFFTTSVAVKDLEALRVALGYEHWNIYGVSYGTRVAAHYARRYPDHTRALVLDGVVPPEVILGANVIFNSQKALEALDQRCQEDTGCSASFEPLRPIINTLKTNWTAPVNVHFPHPVTGKPDQTAVTWQHLAATIRLLLYAPETAAIIPVLLSEAADGNLVPVAAQARMTLERISHALADGMHNAIVCTEDVPFFGAAESDLDSLDATYLGSSMTETLKAVCSTWPQGIMDADLHEPLRSDVPALLLSGEFDPITPPAHAGLMLAGLPRGRALTARGQGHGVLIRGCVSRLVTNFLDTLDSGALDARCLERPAGLPPFVDLLGPTP